ncbi:unknown [Coraliomargarita sp. CAG:312]|nr:unknown [Coraliomargarita sp. CAG:312]
MQGPQIFGGSGSARSIDGKEQSLPVFFSQKAFEEIDNASMGIVRKVWEQGHVIRKKNILGKMQAIWLIRI